MGLMFGAMKLQHVPENIKYYACSRKVARSPTRLLHVKLSSFA